MELFTPEWFEAMWPKKPHRTKLIKENGKPVVNIANMNNMIAAMLDLSGATDVIYHEDTVELRSWGQGIRTVTISDYRHLQYYACEHLRRA